MDRHIIVQSNESNDHFPTNTPYHFRIHLESPIFLQGHWLVALIEFHANSIKKKDVALYIYSNLCKETIVHGKELPLLRRIAHNSENQWSFLYKTSIYMPVKQRDIYEFEVYIKDAEGNLATFLKEPTVLTLHLKPYPFFM